MRTYTASILLFLLIFPQFVFAEKLTKLESDYVRMIGTVNVCVDPDWYPFEKINENGEYVGIASDLMRLVAKRTGLKIELYKTASWDESLQASKEHKCQLLGFLNETPQRDSWLYFTKPHFTDINVFITREEHHFIADPAALTNETIVFPSGTAMEELVKKRYPNLKIITTQSENEAFQMVSDKKADMTMRSLIMAAYTIKNEGLFNLKISGQLPSFNNEFRIGVIKSEPLLVSILNKGISSITNLEREQIVNKYVYIKAETAVDYMMISKILAIFGVFVIFSLYWGYRMKSLNAKLKKISQTDILTGLYNRTKLNQQFSAEVERAKRYKRPLSVIMMDIDHFKKINDEFGHLAGDRVLMNFARIALCNIRGCDIIGRWGGEEFLVLCPETDIDEAVMVANRIRQAVAEACAEKGCSCTVSAGVAVYGADDTEDSLLSRADAAMYQAKNTGRDRVCSL